MSAVHLPCRVCAGERCENDIGTGLCTDCRRKTTRVTQADFDTAIQRCRRDEGGSTPRVAWMTARCDRYLWRDLPPMKEGPSRVMIIPLDA